MNNKKEFMPTKQLDLSSWVNPNIKPKKEVSDQINKKSITKNVNQKPKLAFGYGYNPENLKQGIKSFSFSHTLSNSIKLYEFQPKISYRIFKILAKIMNYNWIGSELRKNNTIIKNHYFTTDQKPEQIIKEIDFGIRKIFEIYDPLPEYNV